MIIGIQLFGIFFALMMIYFTYLYYKRGNYGKRSLVLWTSTWIGVIIIFAVPKVIYSFMNVLSIDRTADFFSTIGIVFLASIVFYLYGVVKKNEKKMEQLVRAVAIKNAHKPKVIHHATKKK